MQLVIQKGTEARGVGGKHSEIHSWYSWEFNYDLLLIQYLHWQLDQATTICQFSFTSFQTQQRHLLPILKYTCGTSAFLKCYLQSEFKILVAAYATSIQLGLTRWDRRGLALRLRLRLLLLLLRDHYKRRVWQISFERGHLIKTDPASRLAMLETRLEDRK